MNSVFIFQLILHLNWVINPEFVARTQNKNGQQILLVSWRQTGRENCKIPGDTLLNTNKREISIIYKVKKNKIIKNKQNSYLPDQLRPWPELMMAGSRHCHNAVGADVRQVYLRPGSAPLNSAMKTASLDDFQNCKRQERIKLRN